MNDNTVEIPSFSATVKGILWENWTPDKVSGVRLSNQNRNFYSAEFTFIQTNGSHHQKICCFVLQNTFVAYDDEKIYTFVYCRESVNGRCDFHQSPMLSEKDL